MTIDVMKAYVNLLRPRRRIYLLSHMRANTSLLGHILGSNPDIEGYYELQRKYRNRRNVLSSKLVYYLQHRPKRGARYMFDKLLANHLVLAKGVIGRKDKLIFMIRAPGETIASLSSLFSDRPYSEWATNEGAERYYIDRLKCLQKMSCEFRGQFFFAKAEDLKRRPEELLDELSSYLTLREPLSRRYQVFPNTGVRSAGDSSAKIRSGKIVNETAGNYETPEVAEETKALYAETLDVLSANSINRSFAG